MKHFAAAIAIVALAAVLFSAPSPAMRVMPTDRGGTLSATPPQGAAPLRVTLTGPAPFMKTLAACVHRMGWITPGISIDWGDGQATPHYSDPDKQGQSCADANVHTYSVPGRYVVKARTYHLGPTDAPVTDWTGEAVVVVTGKGAAIEPTIRIVNMREGQAFSYQGMPPVEWEAETGEKVDVRISLRASDGTVVSLFRKDGLAYSGRERAYLSQTEAPYDAALKQGRVPFSLEAVLLRAGTQQVVAKQVIENLKVSAQLELGSAPYEVTPASGPAPLAVQLSYRHFHKECFSYRIDWGDGSPVVQAIKPMRQQCKLEQGVLTLQHVYAQPGNYRIVMRTNNLSPFKALDDIVPYEAADIRVLP